MAMHRDGDPGDQSAHEPRRKSATAQEADESSLEDEEFDDREYSSVPAARSRRNAPREEGPACQACRRKKAKCSRQQPCLQCVRHEIECVYDTKTTKPGMRTGAIESLSRRLSTLENLFLGQGVLWQEVWRCLDAVGARTRLPGSDSGCSPGDATTLADPSQPLQEHLAQLKTVLSGLSGRDARGGAASQRHLDDATPPVKKRRIEYHDEDDSSNARPSKLPVVDSSHADDAGLPPDDLVDALVEIYFKSIHPWIPMLHERQFRETMADPRQRPRLTTVFHAIVSLCARLSDDTRLGSREARASLARRCRQTVILQSMETFSVRNLQALTICAFDIIGSGSGPSAWSIVGSMTRTVEQLQLSVEDQDQPQSSTQKGNTLMKRMAFLPPSSSWVEVEERRRVFWNVFLMDRFSCTTTGWNLSLTHADVRRRLPCEGALWDEGTPLKPTPYFGVSDPVSTSTGALVSPSTQLPQTDPGADDESLLGGFAYCIEATESLSQVTSFFLQRDVDVTRVHDVQMWLVRFKQLDLRLVQWKIFLPVRWREACALNADGNMDPNLTLAHITHNTAVVLLHQSIAYPSPEWQAAPVRLPSALSAETCLAAGTEVAIIAERFLQGTTIPTNPQFAFCLFICGRMLLAHAAYYSTPLAADFDSLVQSLYVISRRWNGPVVHSSQEGGEGSESPNLASKFASRLLQARRLGPAAVDIRQTAYSEDGQQQPQPDHYSGPSTLINMSSGTATEAGYLYTGSNDSVFTDHAAMTAPPFPLDPETSPGGGLSLAYPPLPMAFQAHAAGSRTQLPDTSSKTAGQPLIRVEPMTMPRQDHSSDYHGEAVTLQVLGGHGNADGGEETPLEFEALNEFFDSSFLSTQRVSMFSSQREV